MVYTHNVILLSHKEEQNCVICRKMDGTREYYACLLYTVSGIVNWYNHYGDQYGGSPKD